MSRKKLLIITYIASPHHVNFVKELQQYFDTESWSYDTTGSRAKWWEVELPSFCRVLPDTKFRKSAKYLSVTVLSWLKKFEPDIVILPGFSIPSNLLVYWWCKRKNKKVVVFTERSRTKDGRIRKKGLIWSMLSFLYRNVDMVMVSAEDIVSQFRDEFGFGDKVVVSRYPTDLDAYNAHPLRNYKEDGYTFFFPNRLTEIYAPTLAIEIFDEIKRSYPGSKLMMNAMGELREDCERVISNRGLEESVSFLDNIKSWGQLNGFYKNADIMIFPARFSNGNFTILECMASGMGIVISDKILGVGKLIANKVNGFRVPPTKEHFINAILEYIKKPQLLIQHGKLNKEITKNLGAKGTAKLYADLLKKLND